MATREAIVPNRCSLVRERIHDQQEDGRQWNRPTVFPYFSMEVVLKKGVRHALPPQQAAILYRMLGHRTKDNYIALQSVNPRRHRHAALCQLDLAMNQDRRHYDHASDWGMSRMSGA